MRTCIQQARNSQKIDQETEWKTRDRPKEQKKKTELHEISLFCGGDGVRREPPSETAWCGNELFMSGFFKTWSHGSAVDAKRSYGLSTLVYQLDRAHWLTDTSTHTCPITVTVRLRLPLTTLPIAIRIDFKMWRASDQSFTFNDEVQDNPPRLVTSSSFRPSRFDFPTVVIDGGLATMSRCSNIDLFISINPTHGQCKTNLTFYCFRSTNFIGKERRRRRNKNVFLYRQLAIIGDSNWLSGLWQDDMWATRGRWQNILKQTTLRTRLNALSTIAICDRIDSLIQSTRSPTIRILKFITNRSIIHRLHSDRFKASKNYLHTRPSRLFPRNSRAPTDWDVDVCESWRDF